MQCFGGSCLGYSPMDVGTTTLRFEFHHDRGDSTEAIQMRGVR